MKELIGLYKGVTLGMWLRAAWLSLAFVTCCPAKDACYPAKDMPMWVIFLLIGHLALAAFVVVHYDKEKWSEITDKLTEESGSESKPKQEKNASGF